MKDGILLLDKLIHECFNGIDYYRKMRDGDDPRLIPRFNYYSGCVDSLNTLLNIIIMEKQKIQEEDIR